MSSYKLEKASHSDQRERGYETRVRDIAYRARIAIKIIDEAAFIVVDGEQELLCRPQIGKRLWYETWLAFKERYGDVFDFYK